MKIKIIEHWDGWLIQNADNPEQSYQAKNLGKSESIGNFVELYAKELGIELEFIDRYSAHPILTREEYKLTYICQK
jgi:hypothetical protein